MAKLSELGSVAVNLSRLRNDNAEGHTQAALKRSIYKRARETGTDIRPVGRRTPTEKFVNGKWVKCRDW